MGLVAVGVASMMVDRTEYLVRIVSLHKGTWPVVDGFARDRRIVGVHYAMDEAEEQPARDEGCLSRDHAIQQIPVRTFRLFGVRIVPCHCVVCQRPNPFRVTPRGEVLERTHAKMAGRDTGQHGTWQSRFAQHPFSGHHGGQRTGGRQTQSRHCFTHNIFTQYRTESRSAVAATRERSWARALQLDVEPYAAGRSNFPDKVSAAVAELWHEIPELVSGVGHR